MCEINLSDSATSTFLKAANRKTAVKIKGKTYPNILLAF